jgi:cell division septation protein DedD
MASTTNVNATPKKKTVKAAPATSSATSKTTEAPTKKTSTRTAAAAKPRSDGAHGPHIDPDQRRYYIEVAAYYIAERRGFMGGHEAEDWNAAEVEIDRMLLEGKLNR